MDNNGWSNCSCSTIYTDAWGGVINGPNSGADGTPAVTPATVAAAMAAQPTALALPDGSVVPAVPISDVCAPQWGLIAAAVLAGFVAMHLSKG